MNAVASEGAGAPSDKGLATKGQTAIAWLALLPASSASLIVCRVVLHQEPPLWLGFANLAVLFLLIVIASTVEAWRPLRGYFLALVAFAGGGLIADRIAAGLELGRVARMFANTLLELIPCALLALTLVGSGLTRRDVFLAAGDMAAPSRLPWGTASWRWFGPILTLVLAGGLVVQLTLTLHPDIRMLGRAMRRPSAGRCFLGGERRAGRIPLPRCTSRSTPAGGWSDARAVRHVAAIRSRALVRASGWSVGRPPLRFCRVSVGQEHGRDARVGLGVADSRLPGRGDLFVPRRGEWVSRSLVKPCAACVCAYPTNPTSPVPGEPSLSVQVPASRPIARWDRHRGPRDPTRGRPRRRRTIPARPY